MSPFNQRLIGPISTISLVPAIFLHSSLMSILNSNDAPFVQPSQLARMLTGSDSFLAKRCAKLVEIGALKEHEQAAGLCCPDATDLRICGIEGRHSGRAHSDARHRRCCTASGVARRCPSIADSNPAWAAVSKFLPAAAYNAPRREASRLVPCRSSRPERVEQRGPTPARSSPRAILRIPVRASSGDRTA
jgi:hypothetical protein